MTTRVVYVIDNQLAFENDDYILDENPNSTKQDCTHIICHLSVTCLKRSSDVCKKSEDILILLVRIVCLKVTCF